MVRPIRRGPAPLLPHQLDIVDDDESIWKIVTGGYRSGKTAAGVASCVKMGFRSGGADGLVVGPTFRFCNDVVVRNFMRFLDVWRLEYRYHKSDKILTIGGPLKRFDVFIRSADDPRAIEGITAGFLWGDEWELWEAEALTTAFGRVSTGCQQRLLTGTSEGHGPGYEMVLARADMQHVRSGPRYEVLRSADGRISQWLIETEANTTLSPEYVESMKRMLDPDAADEKLRGIRRAKGGRVYGRFNREIHALVDAPCVTPGKGEVQLYADFNVDKMVWLVAETDKARKATHIVGEIVGGKDNDTSKQSKEALRFLAAYMSRTRGRHFAVDDVKAERIKIFCDANATARTAVTPITNVDILKDHGFRPMYDAQNPAVDDRINTVQVMLEDRRLTFDPKAAPFAVQCIEQQPRKNGQPDKTGGLDHANDALGYGCFWQFGVKRPRAQGTEPVRTDEWGIR